MNEILDIIERLDSFVIHKPDKDDLWTALREIEEIALKEIEDE